MHVGKGAVPCEIFNVTGKKTKHPPHHFSAEKFGLVKKESPKFQRENEHFHPKIGFFSDKITENVPRKAAAFHKNFRFVENPVFH